MRALLFLVVLVSPALGEELTAAARWPVTQEGHGLLEPGTVLNPYEVRDRDGTVLYELHSRFPDLGGLMEGGTTLNPYVIESGE